MHSTVEAQYDIIKSPFFGVACAIIYPCKSVHPNYTMHIFVACQ